MVQIPGNFCNISIKIFKVLIIFGEDNNRLSFFLLLIFEKINLNKKTTTITTTTTTKKKKKKLQIYNSLKMDSKIRISD